MMSSVQVKSKCIFKWIKLYSAVKYLFSKLLWSKVKVKSRYLVWCLIDKWLEIYKELSLVINNLLYIK